MYFEILQTGYDQVTLLFWPLLAKILLLGTIFTNKGRIKISFLSLFFMFIHELFLLFNFHTHGLLLYGYYGLQSRSYKEN